MKVINHVLSSEFDKLNVFGLSDVHLEDKLCNRNRLNKWREEVLSADNNYVIINGDILNTATKSSVSDIFGEAMSIREGINNICDFLEPIKDRILVCIDGNHEKRVYKDTGMYLMEQVCAILGIRDKFCKGAYMLFISFGKNNKRDSRQTVYSIYGKHGAGGGRTVGAKANALNRMKETIDADVYMHSHTHVPMCFKEDFYKSDYRNRKVTKCTHTFVNTNAFLNFGGYGENFGFTPACIDYPVITLNGIVKDVKVRI